MPSPGTKECLKIDNPLVLTKLFANTVTKETENKQAWIPKNGPSSLFRVFKCVFPQAVAPELKGRRFRIKGKISLAEFNKALQKLCGFTCSRSRRRQLSEGGNWLFSNRRWLNPRLPVDRDELMSNYEHLCAEFPQVTSCPFPILLSFISEAVDGWNTSTESNLRKKSPTDALHQIATIPINTTSPVLNPFASFKIDNGHSAKDPVTTLHPPSGLQCPEPIRPCCCFADVLCMSGIRKNPTLFAHSAAAASSSATATSFSISRSLDHFDFGIRKPPEPWVCSWATSSPSHPPATSLSPQILRPLALLPPSCRRPLVRSPCFSIHGCSAMPPMFHGKALDSFAVAGGESTGLIMRSYLGPGEITRRAQAEAEAENRPFDIMLIARLIN